MCFIFVVLLFLFYLFFKRVVYVLYKIDNGIFRLQKAPLSNKHWTKQSDKFVLESVLQFQRA